MRSVFNMTLRISEIFYSLQGEARTVGVPTLFIRLTGCPLRCQYCDTDYAFSGGKLMSLDEILSEVKRYNTAYICVTGGEPLAQPECLPLLTALCDQGLHVSLETSGAMDVAQVDPRVSKVMDLKTPASQEAGRNRYENLAYLTKHDQIKFVICNRHDYDWAVTQLIQYQLVDKVSDVLFSPSKEQLEARELADWIIADQLAVRLQIQLHKILWNDAQGR